MRKLRTGIAALTISMLATGCTSPSNGRQPATLQTTRSHITNFPAPTVIQAPTIANDAPGQSWNFPTDPAKVMQKVYKWLSHATVVTVRIPKVNQNLQFNDYIGPSELYFTDQNGRQIIVAPAYFIAHGAHGYCPALIKNVVSYRDGNDVQYLNAPQLFEWLGNDKNWESDFRMESFTDADKTAIHDAKASKWGGRFTSMFPAIPGIEKHAIQPGGASTSIGHNVTPLPGTVETLVDEVGPNHKVTFIEVWNNGKDQHRWTYVLSPKGAVLSHTQSGDIPPQDWK